MGRKGIEVNTFSGLLIANIFIKFITESEKDEESNRPLKESNISFKRKKKERKGKERKNHQFSQTITRAILSIG